MLKLFDGDTTFTCKLLKFVATKNKYYNDILKLLPSSYKA